MPKRKDRDEASTGRTGPSASTDRSLNPGRVKLRLHEKLPKDVRGMWSAVLITHFPLVLIPTLYWTDTLTESQPPLLPILACYVIMTTQSALQLLYARTRQCRWFCIDRIYFLLCNAYTIYSAYVYPEGSIWSISKRSFQFLSMHSLFINITEFLLAHGNKPVDAFHLLELLHFYNYVLRMLSGCVLIPCYLYAIFVFINSTQYLLAGSCAGGILFEILLFKRPFKVPICVDYGNEKIVQTYLKLGLACWTYVIYTFIMISSDIPEIVLAVYVVIFILMVAFVDRFVQKIEFQF